MVMGRSVSKQKKQKRGTYGERVGQQYGKQIGTGKWSGGRADYRLAETYLKQGIPLPKDIENRAKSYIANKREAGRQAELDAFRQKFGVTSTPEEYAASQRPTPQQQPEQIMATPGLREGAVMPGEETKPGFPMPSIGESPIGILPGEAAQAERFGQDPLKETGRIASGVTTGLLGVGLGNLISFIGAPTAMNKVNEAAAGKLPAVTTETVGKGGLYPANTKTATLTSSWLTRILSSTKTIKTTNLQTGAETLSEITSISTPKAVALSVVSAGTIMSLIGSYPFTGFIKEESLQNLGFGVKAARESGDLQGEEEALDQVQEILNPDIWRQIISATAIVNIIVELKDYVKSALTKYKIDRKSFEKRKKGELNPEDIRFQEGVQSRAKYDELHGKEINKETLSQEEQIWLQNYRGGEV